MLNCYSYMLKFQNYLPKIFKKNLILTIYNSTSDFNTQSRVYSTISIPYL